MQSPILIHINGPFGVGKSTTAELLAAALPGAIIFDPEELGGAAQRFTAGIRSGVEDTDDFQDIALWRTLTVAAVRGLEKYQQPIIMPMTIWRLDYLQEIHWGILELNIPIKHFCLTASLETIQARLTQRGDQPNPWLTRVTKSCLESFQDQRFEIKMSTDRCSQKEISNHILNAL